ncbi:LPXTG-motif cell wall-anchored protein [Streptomyces sp. SLBN-118]|uniref:LPXTG cell wall anchor domain-containing protein n=1 Tax=Streptomyces sp. SLBN-118 TaxID=2768454 RepID=UPI00116DEFF7|nr:LPXTG cell wall anchor domain-containing protein [Streptomyces sp. SLBN-118]TQK50642.1 LPXTG-motif cell wall-anchored protein [Streptomyces sp. SLBN-118]
MPRRSRRRVALAAATAALIAAAPMVLAEPAYAQYPPAPPTLSDDTVAPGDELTFSATGFESNEDVVVSLVPGGAAATTRSGAATAALRTSPSSVLPIVSPTGDRGGDGGGHGGTVYLGTFTADGTGAVSGTVTIPERTRPGDYLFTLEGQESGITLSAPLTVTGDGDGPGDHHGRPGHGHHHGWPGHGGDHGRPGSDNDPSELAKTGSSDATVALLSAAGAMVLLGGGSLVIVRRRRSHAERG